MDELQIKLCDIQGRLFELSAEKKIPSAAFIKAFMISDVAKALDSRYNRMQWMGEEYQKDVLYWIGYIYRYWHYYTGESSTKILRQAPVNTMKRNYLMFHTMDPVVAIEDLKEIHQQK